MPTVRKALVNPRHENFCQYLSRGFTQKQAYIKAGYTANEENTDVMASRLANESHIQTRVAQLVEKNGTLQELSRQEIIGFLTEVINTPAGSVLPDNRLAQGFAKGGKITMPCKMKAVDLLNRMCGNNEPERVEVKSDHRLIALIDVSVLEQLTTGYQELLKSK